MGICFTFSSSRLSQVVRTHPVHPELVSGTFQCLDCQTEISGQLYFHRTPISIRLFPPPPLCSVLTFYLYSVSSGVEQQFKYTQPSTCRWWFSLALMGFQLYFTSITNSKSIVEFISLGNLVFSLFQKPGVQQPNSFPPAQSSVQVCRLSKSSDPGGAERAAPRVYSAQRGGHPQGGGGGNRPGRWQVGGSLFFSFTVITNMPARSLM